MKIMGNFIVILAVLMLSFAQKIKLITKDNVVTIAQDGTINQSFYQAHHLLGCGMPTLYIMKDSQHNNYTITTQGVQVTSITYQWKSILSQYSCDFDSNCLVKINNLCSVDSEKHSVSWIKMETSLGLVEYLVDCDPNSFYKPFEIGLFLLIILATFVLTLSAKYSRAWSYYGWGYTLTTKAVIIFNILILIGMIFAYMMPKMGSLWSQIMGSIIGAIGVMVCVSELLWLMNHKNLQIKVYKKVRILDGISSFIGIIFIPLYWTLDGQWFVNDIMAICTIVALMKLVKLRSLKLGVMLLASLLLLQIVVGVFIHYVFNISYNNYVINMFQNPTILVFPSITPQLYRSCAWLPITAILFPGLLISYLRRFDITRDTHLYFIIGLTSFYLGSVCWMFIDLQTIHSLPFAIISEPVAITIICIQSFRRNQFRIIWNGTFYDQQLAQTIGEIVNKETQIGNTPTAYSDLTNNLRVTSQSSDNYHVI